MVTVDIARQELLSGRAEVAEMWLDCARRDVAEVVKLLALLLDSERANLIDDYPDTDEVPS